jgi:hypothetical protein
VEQTWVGFADRASPLNLGRWGSGIGGRKVVQLYRLFGNSGQLGGAFPSEDIIRMLNRKWTQWERVEVTYILHVFMYVDDN